MENVRITENIFEPDREIDAEALIFNSNKSGQLIEVLVDEVADRAFRANLPTKIFKEEAVSDKKIKVSFKFENLGYINEWLLQFGSSVSVLSPDELKEKRKSVLKKMLGQL
jgi:predicted DNA-binding transcriptional regulator YafY